MPEHQIDMDQLEVVPAIELTEGRPIVARLIVRHFDRLCEGRFKQPFDSLFGKIMLKTLSHLCTTLGASFGFAERAELSLFAVSHGGEGRRLLSRICGEASAKLSLLLGRVATFEGRLYQFASTESACEYFAWRRQEAENDAVEAYCHAALVDSGAAPQTVPTIIHGMGTDEKRELLKQYAVNMEELPLWQQRGSAVHLVDGTGNDVCLAVDLELPAGADFLTYVRRNLFVADSPKA